MCSVRHSPMPSAPRRAGVGGVLAGVGVGAHAERLPFARTASAQPRIVVELRRRLGGGERHLAEHDLAGRAVERDRVALVDGDAAGGERLAGDLDRLGADDGRRAPAAGDDGGVADEAAAGGEDALGDHHPVDVLGARLAAHEDDLLAALGGGLGVVGGEVHLADGGAGRRGEALGDHLAGAGELRVQHLSRGGRR